MEKKISTIPVKGINTSINDNSVEDGFCSKLSNMRYENKAWRVVGKFKDLFSTESEWRIVYNHPVTGESQLIVAVETDDDMVEYANATFDDDGNVIDYEAITSFSKDLTITINHFGNALVFRDGSNMSYYLIIDGSYGAYSTPEMPSLQMDSCEYLRHPTTYSYFESNASTATIADEILFLPLLNTSNQLCSNNSDGYWMGHIAVFVAYKLADGSYIQNSRVMVFENHYPEGSELTFYTFKDSSSSTAYGVGYGRQGDYGISGKDGTNNMLIKPTISIDFDDSVFNVVESVCVFSTRIIPIFDFDKIGLDSIVYPTSSSKDLTFYDRISISNINAVYINKYTSAKDIFTDTKIIDQPFYLIKELTSNYSESDKTIELNYTLLSDDNIVSNNVYSPDASAHAIYPEVVLEYNNRLHYANIKTSFFEGYSGIFVSNDTDGYYDLATRIKINAGDVKPIEVEVIDGEKFFTASPGSIPGRILTYPDYRAENITIYSKWSVYRKILDAPMENSIGNNIAYYKSPSSDTCLYPEIDIDSPESSYAYPDAPDPFFEERNRIQLTGLGNILTTPYANSYEIGEDSTILALNTVAGEVSDTRFGDFPLYVFCDKGIFTLESGSDDVVYSQILPVSTDKITSKSTLAAFGQVFFMNDRGIFAMSGMSSQLISADLNGTEFYEFIENAQMLSQEKYKNILVVNEEKDIAYIYNIESAAWSTREFTHRLINNNYAITTIDEIQEGAPFLSGEVFASASDDFGVIDDFDVITPDLLEYDYETISSFDHVYYLDFSSSFLESSPEGFFLTIWASAGTDLMEQSIGGIFLIPASNTDGSISSYVGNTWLSPSDSERRTSGMGINSDLDLTQYKCALALKNIEVLYICASARKSDTHLELNNGEPYTITKQFVATIDDEEVDASIICEVLTRPIKFNSRDFKRLQTLITRTLTSSIKINIWASNDRNNWYNITSRTLSGEEFNDIRAYRFPMSAKYFKYDITLYNEDSESQIEGWDCEYTNRITHKLM